MNIFTIEVKETYIIQVFLFKLYSFLNYLGNF
jgi:hypothetical protein